MHLPQLRCWRPWHPHPIFAPSAPSSSFFPFASDQTVPVASALSLCSLSYGPSALLVLALAPSLRVLAFLHPFFDPFTSGSCLVHFFSSTDPSHFRCFFLLRLGSRLGFLLLFGPAGAIAIRLHDEVSLQLTDCFRGLCRCLRAEQEGMQSLSTNLPPKDCAPTLRSCIGRSRSDMRLEIAQRRDLIVFDMYACYPVSQLSYCFLYSFRFVGPIGCA